jgi:hypothetical protein
MKISKATIDVLRNFSEIQKNLVINPGNKLSTLSELKHILAETEVADTFPNEVLIYDLNEFLSVLNLVPDGELKFESDCVNIVGSRSRVKYKFAAKELLTYPEKPVKMPDVAVSFDLTSEDIANAKKAASSFGYSTISLNSSSDGTVLNVIDASAPDESFYSQNVGGSKTSEAIEAHFDVANLKLIPGDYKVEITKALISKWTNAQTKGVYYISCEKTSTI